MAIPEAELLLHTNLEKAQQKVIVIRQVVLFRLVSKLVLLNNRHICSFTAIYLIETLYLPKVGCNLMFLNKVRKFTCIHLPGGNIIKP